MLEDLEIRRPERESLDAFFQPRTIAVIGATDRAGSVGASVFSNLQSFPGEVFPVNPRRASLGGRTCYATVRDVPKKVDLVVIATPASTVPAIVRECVDAGVAAAIIISGGFRETGSAGAALEQEILTEARRGNMRIIGPNCLGLINPHLGLNASFANGMALAGHMGLISQSGAICAAILDWSLTQHVGFSAFVSVGSMVDVGWGELIRYLGDDPKTRSIVLYMESIGEAREFLSAAREVAYSKPIIVLKPGRSKEAAQAVTSHTGALAGQDDVLEAGFARCGVVRVKSLAELFDLSEALETQPRPQGPAVAIVTNAGGAGVLATDALLENGSRLASLGPSTLEALNRALPTCWSRHNPVDILGDADPDRFARAVESALQDPDTNTLLVILTPAGPTDPALVAQRIASLAHGQSVPILACWMGGESSEPGRNILRKAGIPTFEYPDEAARIAHLLWEYRAGRDMLYRTPDFVVSVAEELRKRNQRLEKGKEIVGRELQANHTVLTEAKSKLLLAAYDIPTVPTKVARNAEEAVEYAILFGYPVVLKLHSETISHKTDVGGIALDLQSEEDVHRAYEAIRSSVTRLAAPSDFLGVTVQPMIQLEGYELILGSATDSQFGPYLMFGTGGQLVEILCDRAIGLPPLNMALARALMEKTKIYKALLGVRGRKPVNLTALAEILVQFSNLILDHPEIKEIEINPLLASPQGLLALDARVRLHASGEKNVPPSSIRPYPFGYAKPWCNGDLTTLIRPIRPEDELALVRLHSTLSEQSVYQRYFTYFPLGYRTSHEHLARICNVDYARDIVLVAETVNDGGTTKPDIVAVGRLNRGHDANEAELAILVGDPYQKKGLGSEIASRLIEIAKIERISRLFVNVLSNNEPMLDLCRRLGFTFTGFGAGVSCGTISLGGSSAVLSSAGR
jgi:acetyltransferase